MIRIITIEREFGCGGGEIAHQLAERLGWKLWDQQLTEHIAKQAHCPMEVVMQREERTDPLYYRLFKSFLRGSYEGNLNAQKLGVIDSESILKHTQAAVLKVASEGHCVIVGRGSQLFLKDRDDTLRVFLYAPREEKVRRLRERGKSQQEAEELVDNVDRERKEFIAKYFHVAWPNPCVYHLMINTASGDATTVEAITDFMKSFDLLHQEALTSA